MVRLALILLLLLSACGELPVEAPAASGGPPMMPPPPCWDAAGNPLPDDVCAEVAGLTEPDGVPITGDEEDDWLPGPPSMPE